MEYSNFKELDNKSLFNVEGGSWLSDAVCWFFGAMFMTPGKMAVDGAAGHEIMGK